MEEGFWKPSAYYTTTNYITRTERHYVLLERAGGKRILVYKSRSGMMWHLMLLENDNKGKLLKRMGEYSTSFVIDLRLQEEIEKFIAKNEPERVPDNGWVINKGKPNATKNVAGRFTVCEDGKLTCSRDSPFYVFVRVLKAMAFEKIPDCGGAVFALRKIKEKIWDDSVEFYYKSQKKKSFDIYKDWARKISTIMSQYFLDLGGETFLFESSNQLSNVCLREAFVGEDTVFKKCWKQSNDGEAWVTATAEIDYRVYSRTIRLAEPSGERFSLIYARYTLFTVAGESQPLVIPLFILKNERLDKDVPVYLNVGAVGLYTCKIFEYRMQLFGDIHAPLHESASKAYAFIGDAMDKMWPFHREEDEGNLRAKKRRRLKF